MNIWFQKVRVIIMMSPLQNKSKEIILHDIYLVLSNRSNYNIYLK